MTVETKEAPVAEEVKQVVTPGADSKETQGDGKSSVAEEKEESTLLGEASKETEGVKDGEKVTPETKAPEKYEFKAPEGMTLDQVAIDKFTPVFKEADLSQAQAQKLVDAYAPFVNSQIEARNQELNTGFKEIVTGWKNDSIKELGNDYKKEVSLAAKGLDKYGTPELREVLEQTGLGNHIQLIRAFAKVGKMLSQDSFVDSSKKLPTEKTEQEKLDILYPTMKT